MGDGWSWLFKELEESEHLAREGWAEVKRAIAEERYEFLLLDEMTYPIKWGWIDVEDVVATLRDRPGFQHVVITGRDAAPELLEAADLVSEVVKVKHPLDAGIRAQQGIAWKTPSSSSTGRASRAAMARRAWRARARPCSTHSPPRAR